jgi:hypothetical protein
MKVERVTLIAKSRQGEGRAWLRIGRAQTSSRQIRGTNFNSDNNNTFDRDTFENPNNNDNSNGVWQLGLRGQIKVKRVIVEVDDDNGGGGNIRDQITLRFNDEQFQGNSTLHLRQEILQQTNLSPADLNRVRVERVDLWAKSRQGNGRAALKIGNRETNFKEVDGRPSDFNDDDLDTYERIRFENPNNNDNSNGVWQILLRGNIKVKRVVLHFDD